MHRLDVDPTQKLSSGESKEWLMINVGIVDDHAIVRTGLREFISEQADLRVIGEAASGRSAVDLVRTSPGMDVLVLDLSMPGQSGIDVLAMIRAKAPELGILILSGYPEEQYALSLLRQGASGYLNKDCDSDEILNAIRIIAAGKRYLSAAVGELLARQLDARNGGECHQRLSQREFQVFLKLATGSRPGDIADNLCLTVKTISTYRTRLMDKMHLATNSDLTYYALKHKLID